jgi:hypothetical protein
MHALKQLTSSQLLRSAGLSGTTASLLSAATLALCSKLDQNSFAGGLNGPSQWLWGEREASTRAATLKHTAVGYLVHHATSTFWALCYQKLFGSAQRKSAARILGEAAALSAAAYLVDYKLTPRRLQPGFEKHVKPRSMVAVYASFALGLAAVQLAGALARRRGTSAG